MSDTQWAQVPSNIGTAVYQSSNSRGGQLVLCGLLAVALVFLILYGLVVVDRVVRIARAAGRWVTAHSMGLAWTGLVVSLVGCTAIAFLDWAWIPTVCGWVLIWLPFVVDAAGLDRPSPRAREWAEAAVPARPKLPACLPFVAMTPAQQRDHLVHAHGYRPDLIGAELLTVLHMDTEPLHPHTHDKKPGPR